MTARYPFVPLSTLTECELDTRLADAVEHRESVAYVRELVAAGAEPRLAGGAANALIIDAIRNYPAYIPVLYVPDETHGPLQTQPWLFVDARSPCHDEALARLARVISKTWKAVSKSRGDAAKYASSVVGCISSIKGDAWPANVPTIPYLEALVNASRHDSFLRTRAFNPLWPCSVSFMHSLGFMKFAGLDGQKSAQAARFFASKFVSSPAGANAVRAWVAAGVFDDAPWMLSAVLCRIATRMGPISPKTIRVFVDEFGVDLLGPCNENSMARPMLFHLTEVRPSALPAFFAAGADPNACHPRAGVPLLVDVILHTSGLLAIGALLDAGACVFTPWTTPANFVSRAVPYTAGVGVQFALRVARVGLPRALLATEDIHGPIARHVQVVKAHMLADIRRHIVPLTAPRIPSLFECAVRALGQQQT